MPGWAHLNIVFTEHHGLEFEIVIIPLSEGVAPGVRKRNRNDAALHHQTGCGGQLSFVIPHRTKSEGDVGHDAHAVFDDLNGVGWMEFDQVGVAQTGGPSTFGREQEGGLSLLAVNIQPVMGDAPPNDLVLGGDGLPLLGRRKHRWCVHHGPVLEKNGARGLQADDLNGQSAALVRHERQRDGLHAADVLN